MSLRGRKSRLALEDDMDSPLSRHRAQQRLALEGEIVDEDVFGEVVSEDDEEDNRGDALEFAADVRKRMPMADELAFKAQLRNEKWDQLNAQAPFQQQNPPSVLTGTLGGQQQVIIGGPLAIDVLTGFTNGPIIPDRTQVALWGGDDSETMPVTVTFGPVQRFSADANSKFTTPPPPVRAYGIVKFGTRGFLVQATVDIGQGCQFTVSGSQISLEVGVEDTSSFSLLSPFTSPNAFIIPLTGMLSFRQIVRTSPLTRTLFMDTAIGGGAIPLSIPPFSKEMWIVQNSGATVTVFDSGGNVIMVVVAGAGVPLLDSIILPGDAAAVTATGGDTNIRLVFGLSI